MFQYIILVLEKYILAPNRKLRLAIDPIGHEVASLDKFLLDDAMQTGIFIASRYFFMQILARAKLSEILRCFGADVSEELERDPAYLLFVGVQIEKDDRVVLASDHSCHPQLLL